MTGVHLQKLFEYSREMNQSFIDKMAGLEAVSDEIQRQMSHVLNACYIWIDRLEEKESGFSTWHIHSLEEMTKRNKEIHERAIRFIRQNPLDGMLHYQNSKGDQFSTSTMDILMHVVNHSTHHRGQVVRHFQEQGIKPPVSDYIFFVR